MMTRNLKLLYGVLFLFFAFGVKAKEVNVVHDKSSDWLYYDEDYEHYLPVIDYEKSYDYLALMLDENVLSSEYEVSFTPPVSIQVFVGNKIYKSYLKGEEVFIPMEALLGGSKAKLFLLVYPSEEKIAPFPMRIVKPSGQEEGFYDAAYDLILRGKDFKQNLILISLMMLLLIFSILKVVDSNKLNAYFNVFGLFSRSKIDEHIVLNAFSLKSMPFVIASSLVIAVFMMCNDFSFFAVQNRGSEEGGFGVISLFILMNALIVFVFLVLKYVYIVLLSYFVSIKNVNNLYYFETIRFYTIAFLMLTILSIIFNSIGVTDTNIEIISVFVLLFWMVRIFFIFMNRLGFHKIYIISYLCTSEILPLFILLKVVRSF